ncbi:MAG: ATP-dependent helicase [Actinomycetota bacterium]
MFDPGGLNPAQLRAVEHGDGPLLIVAGAGTGKTATLAARVARLLDRGIAPQRIMLLTFSRRGAREMLSRAERMTGDGAAAQVWGGTFHAVANRLLRTHGKAVGLLPDFTVLDQADVADIMNLLRNELGYGAGERRFPRKETLAQIYSRTVNTGDKLREVLRRWYPWCAEEREGIRAIFTAYATRKRETNTLDYDDLLLFWNALLATPETAVPIAERFEHLLVDEYQDTNPLQAQILEHMRPESSARSITVVGDDAQAIYGFRAATVRNILEFPQRFCGASVIRLEQNYRSTPSILAATNAVIARSPQRHDKTLWSARGDGPSPALHTCADEAEQADVVCRNVLAARERGVPLLRQAVLFRAAHHSDALEIELARRNIPFVKYGGLKFLEAAHVKDALALLRILENPHDEVSWFRALLLLDGVGPTTARAIVDALAVRGAGPDATSPLTSLADAPPRIPVGAQRSFDLLREGLVDCARSELGPAGELERLRPFLEASVRRRYEHADARLRDIDVLTQLASAQPARGRFLAELALDPPSSTGELAGPPLLDEDYLVLSTIHSAKGLEWDSVHVLHAADGNIPSDMATGDEDEIEEERRLLYVAMTRAKDSLTVLFPQRYYRRRDLSDPHSYAQLSRFLTPPEVLACFERIVPDPDIDEPAASGVGGPAGARASVDGALAELWAD